MLLDLIAGVRPNFVKLAPIIRALDAAKPSGAEVSYRFIHTGQHSGAEMSEAMLRDLELPAPDIQLQCPGDTRGAMLSSIISAYDAVLQKQKPDWTVVVGDVTSTLGAALAAKSAGVRLAHVEAGLRSGDRTMPEELNRIATDAVADVFFTTSRSAGENLLREGVDVSAIHFVGNTMVDALLYTLPRVGQPESFRALPITQNNYALVTLHRPANVDDPARLQEWIDAISKAVRDKILVFPVHPRTAHQLTKSGRLPFNFLLTAPLPYRDFLYFQHHSALIITDSGGVCEEATILAKPCVTLRTTTERRETVEQGTNVLALSPADLHGAISEAQEKAARPQPHPDLWDGQSSQRIVNALLAL